MARLVVTPQGVAPLQSVSTGRVQMNTQAPVSQAGAIIESLKGFAPALQKFQRQKEEEDSANADAFFRSKTLEEVGQMVRDGALPPDASPVFQARVQNLYGSNYLSKLARETEEKLANGELVDATAAEEYLTTARNEFLKGQSEYTVAGFDRQFLDLRTNVQQMAQRQATERAVEDAVGLETENLVNITATVRKPDAFGVAQSDPAEIARVVSEFKRGASFTAMPPAQRKMVLGNMVQEFIANGDETGLKAFLEAPLDNGLTVGTVVYGKNRAQMRQALSMGREGNNRINREAAEREHDALVRQAEQGQLDMARFEAVRSRFDPYKDFGSLLRLNESVNERALRASAEVDSRIAEAQAGDRMSSRARLAVTTLLTGGETLDVTDETVTLPDGRQVSIAAKPALISEIKAQTQGNIRGRLDAFARFALVDEETKTQFLRTLGTLNATLSAPAGQPLPQSTLEGLQTFREARSVNPAYTQSLIGADKYRELELVDDMVVRAGVEPREAAQLLSRIRQSGLRGSDAEGKVIASQVQTELNRYADANFLKVAWRRAFGSEAERALSDYGQAPTNFRGVSAQMRNMAVGYVMSGLATSAEDAVQQIVSTSLADGRMQRGHTGLYWSSDLPQRLPAGIKGGEAISIFARALSTTYRQAGREVSPEQIELMPDGNGRWSVFVTDSNGRRTQGSNSYSNRQIEAYMVSRQRRLDAQQVEEQRATRSTGAARSGRNRTTTPDIPVSP